MRILIDLQGAQSKSRFRGIGRYTLSLAKAIAKNRGDHEIFIALNALFPETLEELEAVFAPLLPKHHILIFHLPSPVDALPEENSWRVRTAEAIREKYFRDCAPDMVLVTSLFEGSSDNSVTSVKSLFPDVPTAVIMYDLIRLLNPELYLSWEPLKKWYFRKLDSLKRADLLLGISESASNEAIEHLSSAREKVITISSAADEMFESIDVTDEQIRRTMERFGIEKKYLMHSSMFEPRKNFEGLIKAFAKLSPSLRRDFQLVLVCKIDDAGRSALHRLARDSGLENGELVLTGYVSDDELIALYHRCHLFVFPSLHEGFGLPILEAMWCGAPAIGSNTSSIPEVIGREDALFDPTSPSDMARVIERALSDPSFYDSLLSHASAQCRRFSWDASAQKTVAAFEAFHARYPLADFSDDGYPRLIRSIASIDESVSPNDSDLIATAIAIDKNEKSIARLQLFEQKTPPLTWRIEGPFDSTYSLALLNRETARALDELGHFVVLHSTEGPGDFPPNPLFLAANPDMAVMHARSAEFPHDKVDVASRNLYPPRVEDMHAPINLLHHYAWEESAFPAEWVEQFNRSLSGITALSSHVEKILIDAGVDVPMSTSGCGVDHWERIAPSPYPLSGAKSFRFLHVSSCFPRKGVDDLLEAYGRAFTQDDDVTLVVKTFKNPHNEIHNWLASARAKYPRYPHVIVIEEDLSDERLKGLYGECHALVAPSRAEGYGLPMAEAMLSGLVVITTGWGGQLDFCNADNAFLVDFSFEQAQTHFELFDSVWAKVDIDDLARTMQKVAALSPEELRTYALRGREELLENHTWRAAAARLVAFEEKLRTASSKAGFSASAASADEGGTCFPESKYSASPEASFSASAASADEGGSASESIKNSIAWISTYNTKCGIASYSEHLIHAMGEENVTVLAPFAAEPLCADPSNVIRCWKSAKEDNGFDTIAQEIEKARADILIIQFNYGFFHFGDFSEFIHAQIDAGRTLVVMMHSTTDPEGNRPNLRLAELVPALQRVDRVLVHSIPDLNRLKAHGLVANVALFPHGVLTPDLSEHVRNSVPLVATYGFCLPHKGFPELLHALRILLDSGKTLRLRFVTAEYPIPLSAEHVEHLRTLIRQLRLEEHVELYTDYLPDDESLALLAPADLLVFAYQHTGESSSAAVRYGIATGRPVAVTPLAIFDDVRVATHTMEGTSPEAIASGIASALDEIFADSPQAQKVAERSHAWRTAHAYDAVGKRLYRLCIALRRKI